MHYAQTMTKLWHLGLPLGQVLDLHLINSDWKHHLLQCYRTPERKDKMESIDTTSVFYGQLKENFTDAKRHLFWLAMCVINKHIKKTRAQVVLEQKVITSDAVFNIIVTKTGGKHWTSDVNHFCFGFVWTFRCVILKLFLLMVYLMFLSHLSLAAFYMSWI